jgi:hypothetical protein
MTTTWSTAEEIAAARETIAASIDGWSEPAVWAVGLTSATSSAEYEFPVVNVGEAYLAAVVLAKTIGYASGTSTHVISVSELTHALDGASPAEAYRGIQHRNLQAWREILAEVESNPYRGMVAVFIGDRDDPVSSEADGWLRTQLPD